MKTKMEIVLISVLCGVLMTLDEAFGNTSTRLQSKVIGDKTWFSKYKSRSHLVWVRIEQNEICTGFIIGRKAFMSTGDCSVKIDRRNSDLLIASGCRLEVYYRTYDHGRPFITNFVSHVEKHPDYKFRDTEKKKKFSAHNFGIIHVKKLFNGNFAIEVEIPSYAQELPKKEPYILIGWDSSLFDKTFSEIAQEPEIKEVSVVLMEHQICENIYWDNGQYDVKSYNGYICVEIMDGSQLTKADIGSPILDVKDLVGVIAYVPDPSLNLPALMIKRSKIGCKLHIPRDGCSYFDENLGREVKTVDPADEELGDSMSETEIGTSFLKKHQPRDWYEFLEYWACCCSKFDYS